MLSVLERVRALLDEIAMLKNANEIYKRQKGPAADSERERRRLRLLEIQDELKAMTEWKKL